MFWKVFGNQSAVGEVGEMDSACVVACRLDSCIIKRLALSPTGLRSVSHHSDFKETTLEV